MMNRARTLFEGKNLVFVYASNEREEKPLPRASGCHMWGGNWGGEEKRVRRGHINHVTVGGPNLIINKVGF